MRVEVRAGRDTSGSSLAQRGDLAIVPAVPLPQDWMEDDGGNMMARVMLTGTVQGESAICEDLL